MVTICFIFLCGFQPSNAVSRACWHSHTIPGSRTAAAALWEGLIHSRTGNDNFIVVHQWGLRCPLGTGLVAAFVLSCCSQSIHIWLYYASRYGYMLHLYIHGYSLGSPNKFNFDVFAWKTKIRCSEAAWLKALWILSQHLPSIMQDTTRNERRPVCLDPIIKLSQCRH